MNKYDRINLHLSKIFSMMLTDFTLKSENEEEEKIMILIAETVWNISYLDKNVGRLKTDDFLDSFDIEETERIRYTNMMLKGIRDKRKAA